MGVELLSGVSQVVSLAKVWRPQFYAGATGGVNLAPVQGCEYRSPGIFFCPNCCEPARVVGCVYLSIFKV